MSNLINHKSQESIMNFLHTPPIHTDTKRSFVTFESAHNVYQDHHRFILNHRFVYHALNQEPYFCDLTGTLHFINDEGTSIPCSNILIAFVSNTDETIYTTHSDDNGSYYFKNIPKQCYYIRLEFSEDTIINYWNNIVSEKINPIIQFDNECI
jgi:hypothetical protein